MPLSIGYCITSFGYMVSFLSSFFGHVAKFIVEHLNLNMHACLNLNGATPSYLVEDKLVYEKTACYSLERVNYLGPHGMVDQNKGMVRD